MAELNPFASFAQGRRLAMDRRAEERLIEDREREAATRNRMAQLFAGGMPTTKPAQSAAVAEIARTDPGAAMDWSKHFAGMEGERLKRRQAEAPFVVAQLGQVKDQAGYDRARANLDALGVDVSDMPPEYAPDQINMVTQAARYLAEGPPEAPASGPFRGDAQWAQDRNTLITKDPATQEYAAAYAAMAAPRRIWDAASGQMIQITPDMSPYAAPEWRGGTAGQRAARKEPQPMAQPGQQTSAGDVKPVSGMTVTQIGDKPLTEGQKARDREFGKEYVTWTGGGQADAEKNIGQLEEQILRLESGENITGTAVGRLPDIVAETFVPGAVDVRDQVEEVVQRNLREILGAQFTEKEGERLIRRAYNPRLDEAVNARRLRRLVVQMRNAANAKNAMAEHFDQFGTLQGYAGPRMMTMQQMGDMIEAEEAEIENEPTQATQGLPRPKTKAERDALPPGTPYIAPDGTRAVRK